MKKRACKKKKKKRGEKNEEGKKQKEGSPSCPSHSPNGSHKVCRLPEVHSLLS